MRAESSVQAASPDMQAQLVGMGFSLDQIKRAVAGGCDSVVKAVDYIHSNPPAPEPAATVSSSSNMSARAIATSSTGGTATSAVPIDVDPDSEYQRAINASKAEAKSAETGGDPDLARAIEASLKDNVAPRVTWPDETAKPPDRRIRANLATPVGLRNIGNTCYLNSLLQVYYHLPAFRRAVFAYRPPSPAQAPAPESESPVAPVVTSIDADAAAGPSPASASVAAADAGATSDRERTAHAREFMLELQRLFAQMALGNQSIVDPSALVRALRDADGRQIEIGAQQDAAEFNQLVLSMVELAVAPEKARARAQPGPGQALQEGEHDMRAAGTGAAGAQPNLNFVRALFNTNFKQEVVQVSPDRGSLVSSRAADGGVADKRKFAVLDGETSSFIVDACAKENRELYHGLDEYAHARIEYRFDEGDDGSQTTTHVADSQGDPMCISGVDGSPDSMKIDTATKAEPALKSEWFTNLSPVLTVYLGRVRFNKGLALAEKVHEKYFFKTEIAMDRYLEKNKVESEKARKKVGRIQAERRKTEEKLNGIVHFPGTKPRARPRLSSGSLNSTSSTLRPVMIGPLEQKDVMPHAEAMDTAESSQDNQEEDDDYFSSLDRVKKRLKAATDPKSSYYVTKLSRRSLSDALKAIESLDTEDRLTRTALKEKVDALTIEENKCYESLDSVKYQLWAVLVHDGAPSSGHYLVFIRSTTHDESGKSLWMRFSDVSMTYASEEEMLLSSVGGYGHASAYCLIYVSSSQIPTAQSRPFEPEGEKFAEHCQQLLPKDRLDEVKLFSLNFTKELSDYRVKLRRNNVNARVRSIVEMATADLRVSSMKGTAMNQGSSSSNASSSVKPPPLKTMAEFCLSGKFHYSAIAYSLKKAWATHASNGNNPNIFDVARQSIASMQAFPPLPGNSDSQNVLDTDFDLLVLQEIFCIMKVQKITPALGSGDSPFLNIAEAKNLPEYMQTPDKLKMLEERTEEALIMYRFALRSTVLTTHALDYSFRGSWRDALTLLSQLGLPHHLLSPKNDETVYRSIADEFFGLGRTSDKFRYARHTKLVQDIIPTIIVAASDDAAERLRFGTPEGRDAAVFVAEFVRCNYDHNNDMCKIIMDDWRTYFTSMRNGTSPYRESAIAAAAKVIQILTAKMPPTSNIANTPISAELNAKVDASVENAAATTHSFNKLVQQVYTLGLIASDGPSVRRAAQQLREHAANSASR